MTSSSTSALEPPDFDLVAEARFFTERLCWPVTVDALHRRLVLCTDVLGAFRVPKAVAEPTARTLAEKNLAGPICRDHYGRWWTIFTSPSRRQVVELPPAVRSAGVYAVPSGGHILLPPISAPGAWWEPPRPGHPPPPWQAVMATIRDVVRQ